MDNLEYRLDRNSFQAMTYEEADKQMQDSTNLTQDERFDHFNYLMSVAYRFLGGQFPRMDKTAFEKIKRS